MQIAKNFFHCQLLLLLLLLLLAGGKADSPTAASDAVVVALCKWCDVVVAVMLHMGL